MKLTCYTAIMDGGTKQRKDKDLGRDKDKQRGPEFNSIRSCKPPPLPRGDHQARR